VGFVPSAGFEAALKVRRYMLSPNRRLCSVAPVANEERPTERLVAQRIRNRVIEYLEMAAPYEDQREYERNVPIANVPYEVINQWEDNFPQGLHHYASDREAYALEEFAALENFVVVWCSTTDALPDDWPTLSQVQAMPEWDELRQAAASALAVFTRRGKSPEDHEVD
jgi:hypothetical protein